MVEPQAQEPGTAEPGAGGPRAAEPRDHRPLIERIGLFGIAAVFTALFAGLALAAWAGGEPILTLLGGIGAFMTGWVGLITLFRG